MLFRLNGSISLWGEIRIGYLNRALSLDSRRVIAVKNPISFWSFCNVYVFLFDTNQITQKTVIFSIVPSPILPYSRFFSRFHKKQRKDAIKVKLQKKSWTWKNKKKRRILAQILGTPAFCLEGTIFF